MNKSKNKAQKPALQQNHVTHIGSWEGKTFPLTEEFVTAVENLLKAEIKMMRQIEPENADCWYCGAAEIRDMASSDYLVMTFGGRDEVDYMSKAEIFVTVE